MIAPADAEERMSRHIVGLVEDIYKALRVKSLPPEWVHLDLTMPQLKILLLLYTDEQATVGHLASLLSVSMSTTSGLLARLERRGLIERERVERDRRLVVCRLTVEGERVASRLWELGRIKIAQLLRPLSAEQMRVVAQALEMIRESARTLDNEEVG